MIEAVGRFVMQVCNAEQRFQPKRWSKDENTEEWLDTMYRLSFTRSVPTVTNLVFRWKICSAITNLSGKTMIETVDTIRGRGPGRKNRQTMYRLSFTRCNIQVLPDAHPADLWLQDTSTWAASSRTVVWFEEDDDDDPQQHETYRSCFRYIAFESWSNWKLWEEKNFFVFWSNSTVLRVNSKRKHRKIDVSEPHGSSPKKCNRVRTSAFSTWCPTTGPSPAFCYQFLLQPRSNQDTLLLLRAKN